MIFKINFDVQTLKTLYIVTKVILKDMGLSGQIMKCSNKR